MIYSLWKCFYKKWNRLGYKIRKILKWLKMSYLLAVTGCELVAAHTAVLTIKLLHWSWSFLNSSSASSNFCKKNNTILKKIETNLQISILYTLFLTCFIIILASLSGAIMASNCRTSRRIVASRCSLSHKSCSEPSSEMPLSEYDPHELLASWTKEKEMLVFPRTTTISLAAVCNVFCNKKKITLDITIKHFEKKNVISVKIYIFFYNSFPCSLVSGKKN